MFMNFVMGWELGLFHIIIGLMCSFLVSFFQLLLIKMLKFCFYLNTSLRLCYDWCAGPHLRDAFSYYFHRLLCNYIMYPQKKPLLSQISIVCRVTTNEQMHYLPAM
jgi:hypothetical protein